MQDMPQHPLPENLIIRARCTADAEGIAALANMPLYRGGTLRMPFQTVEETRSRIEKSTAGDVYLIAELNGQIVGNASLGRLSGRQAHCGMIGMGVHDGWHGHGIGTALLAALVEVADKWMGLRRLELKVYTENAAAIVVYRKFGFEVEGTLRADAMRDGILIDSLVMGRVIAATPEQIRG